MIPELLIGGTGLRDLNTRCGFFTQTQVDDSLHEKSERLIPRKCHADNVFWHCLVN